MSRNQEEQDGRQNPRRVIADKLREAIGTSRMTSQCRSGLRTSPGRSPGEHR
jgi:hypothetical protein